VSLIYKFIKEVMCSGHIELKMTSGNVLTLQEVLHVPTLRRNLISESHLLITG